MIHGFLFLFKSKSKSSVSCRKHREEKIRQLSVGISLKSFFKVYLYANLYSQPSHFSTDKSQSFPGLMLWTLWNQMDKGAELFLFKVQIFTVCCLHCGNSILINSTWDLDHRGYEDLLHWVTFSSFKVRRIIPLDRYLDIFLVLYNWCYIRKFMTESKHYVFTDFSL